MSNQLISVLLGGVLAAVLYGVAGVLQKSSNDAGIGTGPYLIIAGLMVIVVGIIFLFVQKDCTMNPKSVVYSMLFGFIWAVSSGCVAIALSKYGGKISQLAPLYNMNTLVAVVLGLSLMGEWQHVNGFKLLIGTVLIIVGGLFASTS